jgi:fructoselysine-6-P-deglycase FrlB-like protein
LGPAREIALKFTETMQLPISSYGAAEVRHTSASAETPLLVLRQKHGSSEMVDALIADLRVRKKSGWA